MSNVRTLLLLSALLAASTKLSAQPDAASPLAGTGIEPNVVSYTEYNDPLIGLNRAIFKFNDVSYRYVLIPAAHGYMHITPAPIRTGIGNFFDNIKTPVPLINHLLQLKPGLAVVDLARFTINSTLGVAGIFDPASAWFQLEQEDTGMSETLIQYGIGYGAYLVIPLVGPSNLRDGTALLANGYLNPLRYILDNPESVVVRGFDNFQEFAPRADDYLELSRQSEDLYIFMRNLHLQGIQRDADYK